MPTLRPWLSSLFHDMHRRLGTNVSIKQTLWAGIGSHLDEDLPLCLQVQRYAKDPSFSARHFDMHAKTDLVKVPVSTKRI